MNLTTSGSGCLLCRVTAAPWEALKSASVSPCALPLYCPLWAWLPDFKVAVTVADPGLSPCFLNDSFLEDVTASWKYHRDEGLSRNTKTWPSLRDQSYSGWTAAERHPGPDTLLGQEQVLLYTQVWRNMTIIPATWEAEAGGSLV
jgi:hypothetical protein